MARRTPPPLAPAEPPPGAAEVVPLLSCERLLSCGQDLAAKTERSATVSSLAALRGKPRPSDGAFKVQGLEAQQPSAGGAVVTPFAAGAAKKPSL